MTTGIILFAHGSRVEPANQAVRDLAFRLAQGGRFEHVQAAFLELGVPDLEGAVAEFAQKGIAHVIIIPYFVAMGLHLERDLPRIVDTIANNHKDLRISVTAPLDGHPALVEILQDRARSALI
jgi:sirohydrochlorin ferrochelatase